MILFLKLCFKNLYRFLTEPAYRNFFRMVLFHSGKKRNSAFSLRFNDRKIIAPDALSFLWQYWDIFVEEYYYFDTNSEKPVIFDIGSNIGMSILYFRKLYPSSVIYGFEPDGRMFEILSKNLLNSGLIDPGINLAHAAVWINNDGIDFHINGPDSSSIITGNNGANTISVPSVRLKDLLEKEKHIDFLKMDIEGAEVLVLKDCENSLDRVDHIFVEYHSSPGQDQDLDILLNLLKTWGFRFQISSPFRYRKPFRRKFLHPFPEMDLQINIFAFRIHSTK
jgi:FkbM family methyltransferase